jgi:chemotaxis family two-component system sensor kinase Cph1
MFDFFSKLFDTSDFPARWGCGTWESGHGWLHILSDLAIMGAYFAIPTSLLIYYLKKGRELPFPRMLWLFGAFIFSCGTTHLIEAVIFYHPVYRFSGLLKLITAVVSWATVVAIIRIAPRAFKLPGMIRVNSLLEEQIALQKKTERELQRSNKDLGDFTLVVSHDLRSPISSALFMAELAKEGIEKGDTSHLSVQIEHVLEGLRRMDALVKNLHERSLVRAHLQEPEPVKLSVSVELALLDLVKQINETGAHVTCDELPVVKGTAGLFAQLFTNLIGNSIKYSPGKKPVIHISSQGFEEEVIVSVSDNGRGVPPAEISRIFEPLERVDKSSEIGGSGIGLSICRTIMEAHGGAIGAVVNPRGGMVFKLHFPKTIIVEQ